MTHINQRSGRDFKYLEDWVFFAHPARLLSVIFSDLAKERSELLRVSFTDTASNITLKNLHQIA